MNKNNNYKLSIEHRLTSVEEKVDEIINNHVPHLDAKIDRIQWILITTLIGVIINLVSILK